jgi:hypothetical protein
MQRTTVKWGIGGAVVFPVMVFLVAYYKDSALSDVPMALRSLDKALEALSFPLRIWDTVLPTHRDPIEAEEMLKRFWVPMWTSWILYLAAIGFGLGVLLSKTTKFRMKIGNDSLPPN